MAEVCLPPLPESAGPRPLRVVPTGRKVRVAVVGESEIVRAGVAALCRRYPEALEWVARPVPSDRVDVLLVDPWSQAPAWPETAAALLREQFAARQVVCFSWRDDRSTEQEARELGFDGCLPKALPAKVLARQIVGQAATVGAGRPMLGEPRATGPAPVTTRPVGLSSREAQMLRLITAGHTNEHIAKQLYLSPNSVKSYIRSAYRKIGVTRRSQAVRWVMEHPESLRG